MRLHVSADWKERAAGVVGARMSHQVLVTQPEKKRRRRRGKRIMILCATEVKVSGLSTEDRSWRWAAAAALSCWHTFGATGVFLRREKGVKVVLRGIFSHPFRIIKCI